MVELSFALLVLALYGTGAIALRLFRLHEESGVGMRRAFLTLAMGVGTLGQLLFIAGCALPIYTRPVILSSIAVLAVAGIWALVRDLRAGRGTWERPRLAEAVLAVVIVVMVCQWFLVLRGFLPGSDVFSHHYSHAKVMIHAHRFVHQVMLPWGTDMHSNYNPTLVHLLYVTGHLLGDERVSNLFHWLTQALLITGIYVCARQIASRGAALLACTVYFGAGIIANFVPDVHDYTMTAVFFLASLAVLAPALRADRRRGMVLAGVFCGFAMSSKYYGLLFLPALVLIVLMDDEMPAAQRVRHCLRLIVAAMITFSPWLLYNLVQFGDPFYPVFRRLPDYPIFEISYPMHVLRDFIAPSDSGLVGPLLSYYLSLFIPFDVADSQFSLGVLFLITIPAVAVHIVRRPREVESRMALAAFGLFIALAVVFGRVAFYKWAFFPATVYAIALGIAAYRWSPRTRAILWIAAVAAAGLNYVYIVRPLMKTYVPTTTQSARWDEESKVLNATLPPGEVVAGVTARTEYYLRDDLVGIRGRDSLATSWDAEEKVLGRAGATYYVFYEANDQNVQAFYRTLSDFWRQLQPGDPHNADFLLAVAAQIHETELRKRQFLKERGTFVMDFGAGAKLFRLERNRTQR